MGTPSGIEKSFNANIGRLNGLVEERNRNRELKKNMLISITEDLRTQFLQWSRKEIDVVSETIDTLRNMIPILNLDEERKELEVIVKDDEKAINHFGDVLQAMRAETIKTYEDFAKVLIEKTFIGEGSGVIPEIISIGQRLESLSRKLDNNVQLIDIVTAVNRAMQSPQRT